jgi:hypothetical protein
MESRGRLIIRHVIATFASLVVMLLVFMFMNPILNLLVTEEWPETEIEPLNLVCCCSVAYAPGVLVPLSAIGERLLVEKRGWHWAMHIPVMAAMYLIVSVILWEILPLVLVGMWPNQEAVIFMVVDNVIWGVAYWLALRASAGLIGRKPTEGS